MRRAGPLLLLLVALGCDGPIRSEMVALLESTPPPLSVPCADRDARLNRLEPVRTLVGQAYGARTRFDDPLPDVLQAQLMATPLTATTVDDWRCLMGDLQGFDPKQEPNYAVGLGTLAALYFDKGTALLAAMKVDEGWAHVEQGLRLYAQPPAFSYIFFLGAQYFVERFEHLVLRYLPDPATRKRLGAAVKATTMSYETFCRGLNEELLAHATSLYYGHIEAERPRLAARWGPASVAHLDADWARRNRPGRKAWRAYAEVIRVVRSECGPERDELVERHARAASHRLAKVSGSQAALLDITWQRFKHYADGREVTHMTRQTLGHLVERE